MGFCSPRALEKSHTQNHPAGSSLPTKGSRGLHSLTGDTRPGDGQPQELLGRAGEWGLEKAPAMKLGH